MVSYTKKYGLRYYQSKNIGKKLGMPQNYAKIGQKLAKNLEKFGKMGII